MNKDDALNILNNAIKKINYIDGLCRSDEDDLFEMEYNEDFLDLRTCIIQDCDELSQLLKKLKEYI